MRLFELVAEELHIHLSRPARGDQDKGKYKGIYYQDKGTYYQDKCTYYQDKGTYYQEYTVSRICQDDKTW